MSAKCVNVKWYKKIDHKTIMVYFKVKLSINKFKTIYEQMLWGKLSLGFRAVFQIKHMVLIVTTFLCDNMPRERKLYEQ